MRHKEVMRQLKDALDAAAAFERHAEALSSTASPTKSAPGSAVAAMLVIAAVPLVLAILFTVIFSLRRRKPLGAKQPAHELRAVATHAAVARAGRRVGPRDHPRANAPRRAQEGRLDSSPPQSSWRRLQSLGAAGYAEAGAGGAQPATAPRRRPTRVDGPQAAAERRGAPGWRARAAQRHRRREWRSAVAPALRAAARRRSSQARPHAAGQHQQRGVATKSVFICL